MIFGGKGISTANVFILLGVAMFCSTFVVLAYVVPKYGFCCHHCRKWAILFSLYYLVMSVHHMNLPSSFINSHYNIYCLEFASLNMCLFATSLANHRFLAEVRYARRNFRRKMECMLTQFRCRLCRTVYWMCRGNQLGPMVVMNVAAASAVVMADIPTGNEYRILSKDLLPEQLAILAKQRQNSLSDKITIV